MGRDMAGKPPVRGKTSPYGFFVKMCYEEHKKKYPNENVQVTEISKKCSEKWKTMTDDEKRRFFELAQKDAERYQQEMAQYGGDEAFRKRKKIKKDPNAPKRALSAFFCFSQVKRPAITAEHPEWKVGQVAQELGRMWKTMSDDQKREFETMASNDRSRYESEMRDFKAGNKTGPSEHQFVASSSNSAPAPPQQMMVSTPQQSSEQSINPSAQLMQHQLYNR